MDFNDTEGEAAFRSAACAWLTANAALRSARSAPQFKEEIHDTADDWAAARSWQAAKFDAGFGAISWPREFGGRGGTANEEMIFVEEEARFDVPQTRHFMTGNRLIMSALLAHGTDEHRRRHVRRALRGDEIWCQFFSEPGAGSDLAGVRTAVERRGDIWVANGQKTWCTNAHVADYAVMLARSDGAVPKHQGLTFFVVDMQAQGLELRRIRQLTGASHFCEVFINDVHIPDHDRLGPIGGGWKVVLAALSAERTNVGFKDLGPLIDAMIVLARSTWIGGHRAIANNSVRERIATWHARHSGVKFTVARMLTALSKGEEPGPESSIAKLVYASLIQELCGFATELMHGQGIIVDPDIAPFEAVFQEGWLEGLEERIAGGSDEIMRNIIGERILNLPEEPRIDKHRPFNALSVQTRAAA